VPEDILGIQLVLVGKVVELPVVVPVLVLRILHSLVAVLHNLMAVELHTLMAPDIPKLLVLRTLKPAVLRNLVAVLHNLVAVLRILMAEEALRILMAAEERRIRVVEPVKVAEHRILAALLALVSMAEFHILVEELPVFVWMEERHIRAEVLAVGRPSAEQELLEAVWRRTGCNLVEQDGIKDGDGRLS